MRNIVAFTIVAGLAVGCGKKEEDAGETLPVAETDLEAPKVLEQPDEPASTAAPAIVTLPSSPEIPETPAPTIATATTAADCHAVSGFFYGGACHAANIVCATDETMNTAGEVCSVRPLVDMALRADCLKHSGFWYDKADVTKTDAAGFAALAPSCHATAVEDCPSSATELRWILHADGTFAEETSTDNYLFPDSNVGQKVLSTMRCFRNLQYLYVSYAELAELDISNNRGLLGVDAMYNVDLAALDYGLLSNLTTLRISGTKIPALDLAKLPKLTTLAVNDKQTSLDTAKVPLLQDLSVLNTTITSLDLSKVPALRTLNVAYSDVATLDLSSVTELRNLYVDGAHTLDVAALDLSHNTHLETFSAGNLGLTSLPDFYSMLFELSIYANDLGAVDLTSLTFLDYLDASNSGITSIDLTGNGSLSVAYLDGNDLTAIDVSGNQNLEQLYLDDNQLTTIDLAGNTKIKHLSLAYNQLNFNPGKLDLSGMPDLETVRLNGNAGYALNFTAGTFSTEFLTNPLALLYIESAKWNANSDPAKPSWSQYGSGAYTHYSP